MANSLEASLIVVFKGPILVERSRLVKAIVNLFTEYFYSVLQDQPQIFPSQPHCADPAFALRFLECGFSRVLEAFRPSYPPSVVPSAWDGGCARTSLPSPRFPLIPRGLDTSIPNLRAVSNVM